MLDEVTWNILPEKDLGENKAYLAEGTIENKHKPRKLRGEKKIWKKKSLVLNFD